MGVIIITRVRIGVVVGVKVRIGIWGSPTHLSDQQVKNRLEIIMYTSPGTKLHFAEGLCWGWDHAKGRAQITRLNQVLLTLP